jgi:Chitin binding Peritrophin-A domain
MPKVVSTKECPVKGTHFIANPSDCSYYFICNNGVYTLRQCAAGLIFDLLSNNCNYPDQSVCIKEAQGGSPQQPVVPIRPSTSSPGRDNNNHLTAPTPSGQYLDRQKTAGTPPQRWHY